MARRMKRPILAPTRFYLVPEVDLARGLNILIDARENGNHSEQVTGAIQLTLQELNYRHFAKYPKFFFYWHYATQIKIVKKAYQLSSKAISPLRRNIYRRSQKAKGGSKNYFFDLNLN